MSYKIKNHILEYIEQLIHDNNGSLLYEEIYCFSVGH